MICTLSTIACRHVVVINLRRRGQREGGGFFGGEWTRRHGGLPCDVTDLWCLRSTKVVTSGGDERSEMSTGEWESGIRGGARSVRCQDY